MSTIQSFEEIESWKLSRKLCMRIGALIDAGKFKNNYALVNQMEKSSGSIMDNIAEGFERGTRREFITFLGYAKGSCGELRSQLYRSLDRNYINQEDFNELLDLCIQVSALLQKFIRYLQNTPIDGVRKKSTNLKP
ncbi:four helix bundle protein [Aridibaculum aurantiacum]|uniref:four helix bundle protein n=1 Tax=Aridibaculum aurantiacum TaxID=2810307 RepID=UPI001A965BDA|nr:four helix bundle protein [Aridibaculum aurantiacum]